MGIEQWLTKCEIIFTPPGKDGKEKIIFSLHVDDELLLAAYKILAQEQVQKNFEGCIVLHIVSDENEKSIEDINLLIDDFK
jgi:hypothetical protein